MNNWIFTGNLGKDCEVKVTQGGMTICTFSVAVKSGYGDKAKTTWVKCALFGKRAEGKLPEFLVKGTQVCIAGEAFLDEWEKDDVTNKMLKVSVDKLDLIGGQAQQGAAPQQSAPMQQPQQMAQPMQQAAPQPMAPPQNQPMGVSQQAQPMQAAPVQQPAPQGQPVPAQGFDNFDDDIPF